VYEDDLTPPAIPHLENSTFEAFSPNFKLTWQPTDVHPDEYWIYRDGIEVSSGTWESGDNITYNSFIAYGVGLYNFTLVVSDLGGNFDSETTWVTFEDTTNPIIDDIEDFFLFEGHIEYILNWSVFDFYIDYYEIYRDAELIQNDTIEAVHGSYIISISLQELTYGNYTYQCIVWDEYGNSAYDLVDIMILDGTNPIIDSPDDIVFTFGDDSHNITWIAYDLNPAWYELYFDEIMTSSPWNGSEIFVSLVGIPVGKHSYHIIVYDVAGNFAQDIVNVTVTTTTGSTTISESITETASSVTTSSITNTVTTTSEISISTTTPTTPITNDGTILMLIIIGLGIFVALVLGIAFIRLRK
jgi:hypothetical protein